MMDVRDRIEEVGRNIDKNGSFKDDNKKLLGDYISKEELWACTSCNACVEECPISINPFINNYGYEKTFNHGRIISS